ncbi:C69 family dipeptidase [Phenylobacterium aquaticum]|uniref:C69 family dipeptidase n=1 Tax=Phenylobacterium aquaticum TaxID=1763816 RepID=UPI0026F25B1C|nr:C69 family dipeptidase [Phenylobacterium aquaticum]
MCDTLVALPRSTARGATLFAKNSDRERNEAQVLEIHGRRGRDPSGQLKLTYISIPDVEATHACLISRPFWMWGAEMGANEHGVVIGNEALHARTPAQRRRALTGMDLLRLGLERAATAAQAVEVIVDLLERYGQGGDCGHLGRFYYNNGFIIADGAEAYVLETAGRWWAVQKVAGVRALSNAYSIGTDADRVSPAFAEHARAQGWMGADGRFDVAANLIDEVRDRASFGRGRCARGQGLLEQGGDQLTPAAMMAILRDHGGAEGWSPAETVGRTICMHAAEGPRRSQSVASMVSEIGPNRTVHWMTGSSGPCTSLFKPIVLGLPMPDHGPAPTDQFDEASLWWGHERLHRAMLKDFHAGHALIAAERDGLEQAFAARVDAAKDHAALSAAITLCWREAEAAEARWRGALPAFPGGVNRTGYERSWARLNQVAGIPRT